MKGVRTASGKLMVGGEEATRRVIKTADWGGGWDLVARTEGGHRGPVPWRRRAVRETSEEPSYTFPWGTGPPGPWPEDRTPLCELNIQPCQQHLRQHPQFLPSSLLVCGWFKVWACSHKFCGVQSPGEGDNQAPDCPSGTRTIQAGKDAYTMDCRD